MKIPRCLINPVMLPVLACMFAYAWRANGGSPIKLHTDIQWDLASAKKQLLDNVHGQASAIQQLLNSLQWTQQKADRLYPTNGSYAKVIFLLGGPGVGKTEAVKLISENIKCQFRGMWAKIPCTANPITRLSVKDRFSHQMFDDYSSFLRYHGTSLTMLELELSEFNDEHAERFFDFNLVLNAFENEMPRSALIVSGPVMTKGQLRSLTPTQYDQLLDRYALQITKAMNRQAKWVQFTIIKFAKLKPRDMMKYMRPNSSDNEQNLYEIDEMWEDYLGSTRDDQMWTMRRTSEPVDYLIIFCQGLSYGSVVLQLLQTCFAVFRRRRNVI